MSRLLLLDGFWLASSLANMAAHVICALGCGHRPLWYNILNLLIQKIQILHSVTACRNSFLKGGLLVIIILVQVVAILIGG